jgi:hypothetical protein
MRALSCAGQASLIALLICAGCGSRSFEYASGTYQAYDVRGVPEGNRAPLLSALLTLDKAAGTGSLSLGPGSQQPFRFTTLPRGEWMIGCPTQASSAEMEVARLDPAVLSLGGLVQLTAPLLVAQCGLESSDRADVALRADDGQRASGGGACTGEAPCLSFRLGR